MKIIDKYNIDLILLNLCLISSMWILGLDIGPYSLRVYLYLLLIGIIFTSILTNKTKLFKEKYSCHLILIYLLFIIWIFIVDYIRGTHINDVFINLVSTHFLAVLTFICVQFFIDTEKDLIFFGKILIFVMSVSAFFSVMQFFGVKVFWTLAEAMNPIFLEPNSGDRGVYVPGLAFYSISLSYHIITFGGLVWAMLYFYKSDGQRRRGFIFVCLLTGVLFAAVLMTRSRSALVSLILSICLLHWFAFFSSYKQGYRVGRAKYITIMIVLMLLLEFVVLNRYGSGSWSLKRAPAFSGEFGRLLVVDDPIRLKAIEASVLVIKEMFGSTVRVMLDNDSGMYSKIYAIQKLLIGPGFNEYLDKYSDLSPHNMVFSSLIRYGVIGCSLLLALLSYIFVVARKALQSLDNFPNIAWIICGGVVGVAANAFNSLFHNDSYVFGTVTPWWIIGILCSVIHVATNQGSREKVGISTKETL